MTNTNQARIQYLDGLRGIAILTVVLFHAYARWPGVNSDFANFPLFHYGFLGVELFFLISGFVILMTLERCKTFATFMLRRWFRLFPASLFVTLAIFLTAPLLPERPAGLPHVSDLLASLLFIKPTWLSAILRHQVSVIEGVYWSLFVEVIFYVVFGSLYFVLGEARALMAMTGAYLVGMAAHHAHIGPDKFISTLGVMYWGWFMAGACMFRWARTQDRRSLMAAVAIVLTCPFTVYETFDPGLETQVLTLPVAALFFAAVMSEKAQVALSGRFLLFLGFISYPLYLLHENLMAALIVKLEQAAPWMPSLLIPLAPIAVVLGLGWGVATFVEPAIRALLRQPYLLMCRIAGVGRAKPGAAANASATAVCSHERGGAASPIA
jgi:peptidoglycan/LPS O-acetylase OafA/YrhL